MFRSKIKLTADHFFFGIFFGFLSIGLFLGDGKQPLIDTLASVVIISLYIFARYYLSKQRSLPNLITMIWGMNLLYFVIRTIFSDSVAYSITTSMRMVMAYLIFTLFYEYSKDHWQQYLIKSLIIFSLIAIGSGFFLIIFPQYSLMLPLMNLLYANYGHNHLSNILVVVYPIALLSLLKSQSRKSFFLSLSYFLLVIFAFILSFSRGALLLVGLYTLFQVGIHNKKHFKKRYAFVLSIGFLLTLSIIVFSKLTIYNPQLTTNVPKSWLERQLYKPLLNEEGRIKYWKQAWEGFKERPLFGSGPGTFYLVSKRYQQAPNQYSWFAHNFILQTLSELGIVGCSFLVALLMTIILSLWSYTHYLLISSIFLIMLNSLFDFNLDFLIIWSLFWSILGLRKKYE